MTWLTGIVALALMLAILVLDPHQLAQINTSVSHQRWQVLSYSLIIVVAVLWIISYWWHQRYSIDSYSKPFPKSLPPSSQVPHYWYTYSSMQPQDKLSMLVKILCMLLFWLAIICQTLSQRINAIEQSPQQIIYVEATVTPLGLSDKRLEIEHRDTTNDKKSWPKVEQGYRQLVKLTDIKPYRSQSMSQGIGGGGSEQFQETDNPFLDTSLLSTKAALDSSNSNVIPEQMTVMLQSFNQKDKWLNAFSSDKEVRLYLQLSPLEVTYNPDEFDEYRWLNSRHATAKAQILTNSSNDPVVNIKQLSNLSIGQWVDTKRFELREHFLQLLVERRSHTAPVKNSSPIEIEDGLEEDAVAVTLSLLTGDRSLISQEMTGLYRFAGISHLLAISGTHVLFLAMLCAGLTTALINRFRPSIYTVLPRWQCAFIIAVLSAFSYAAFAGFDVPAVRTACMLLAVGVMRYLLALSSTFKILLGLAVAMAWSDIFILWQAGFWLSFIAVAVLIVYSQRWERNNKRTSVSITDMVSATSEERLSTALQIKKNVIGLIKLQLWMSIALLPISLWLFGKVSLWGFGVNLFAIGLFGWVIVPLNLMAGVLYIASPILANKLWVILFWILDIFHSVLIKLEAVAQQVGWLHTDVSVPALFLILLLVLPWMLPKGILSHLLSLPALLMLGFLSIYSSDNSQGSVTIYPLNTKDSDNFALLVMDGHDSWLLLSSYSNKRHVTANNAATTAKTTDKMQQLSNLLYEQLKKHKLKHLTGVVVQTSSPLLSQTVASLRDLMPISHYWQAGLSDYNHEINRIMKGSRLTAQSCVVGRHWQTESKEGLQGFSIKAITGWEVAKDNTVSDCTLLLNTENSSNELLNKELLNKKFTINGSDLSTNQKFDVVNNLHPVTAVNAQGNKNQVIIYTSAQPKLAKLWQLMCTEEYVHRPKSSSRKKVNNSNIVRDSNINDASLSDLQNQSWITSAHARIDNSLLDHMHPIKWQIIDEQNIPNNSDLKERYLYWQQLQSQAYSRP